MSGIAIEPRKKSCSRNRCGRCANCLNKEWRRVWESLLPEDIEWVGQEYIRTYWWAGRELSMKNIEWVAGPSMTEYVLR